MQAYIGFSKGDHILFWLNDRLYVPYVPKFSYLLTNILLEVYASSSVVHPRAIKMYHDVRSTYWWSGMKKNVIIYVQKCLTC